MTKMSPGANSKPQVNGTGKTVLVVEDNELNMMMFHDLLEARGFAVLQALAGEEGWRLAQEHRSDLILMDIQLSDTSGAEIIRRLKRDETLRMIPVIAVTAFAMAGDKEKYLEVGCDAYLAKPVSISDLLRVVAEAVNGSCNTAEKQAVSLAS
jgi:two-component system cell cycle response regulator DivK